MNELDRLLTANQAYADAAAASVRGVAADAQPRRHLAVVTCMDTRIDVLAALGLRIGEAHVIRNAGGRVTNDVLRSLALSCHALGVDTVAIMEHTRCGLAGATDDQLRQRTGADLEFLAIGDHAEAIRADVALLRQQPYLAPVRRVGGFLYDVETGRVEPVVTWERSD